MGKEERAAMYFELEAVNKELKEKRWKLDQTRSFIAELDVFLKGNSLDNALNTLEKPANKSLLNLEGVAELIRTVLELEAKKADLEGKLGSKITME